MSLSIRHEVRWSWAGKLTLGDLAQLMSALADAPPETELCIASYDDQRDGRGGSITANLAKPPTPQT